jgi:hypothetical protein
MLGLRQAQSTSALTRYATWQAVDLGLAASNK